jgi:hypothetical protein
MTRLETIAKPTPGKWDLRPCRMNVVSRLVEKHHGYGSSGATSTYAFAVFEDGEPVAVYAWQPPPIGAAKSICPEAAAGVLALSRMAAVPKGQRRLKHVSKPLRVQMLQLIDRGRWPVLVTYSDESQGHTGYVYQCSGWTKTVRSKANFFVDEDGNRASPLSNGKWRAKDLTFGGVTHLQRWEHWACEPGEADAHMASAGWERVPRPGRVWRSGNPAYRWIKTADVA